MRAPRFWQTNNLLSTLLLPFSWLYAAGAMLDRYCNKPQRAAAPVISIGNVTAGGTGKTPTALALVPMLQALGHVPHILTRGYQGEALTAHRVQAGDSPTRVGDEALLLAAVAPTWVGRDRLASAAAATKAGATVLVCDDALQHHALAKDLSLLVTDGPYGIGNGKLLPAGPLRESLVAALKRCDAAICIGKDAQQLGTLFALKFFSAELRATGDTAFLVQHRWFAFAGIGRPQKFYASLREAGGEVVGTRDFADHHMYQPQELSALAEKAAALDAKLITTEKDAVKLPADFRAQVAVLPVALTFTEADKFQQFLKDNISRLVQS